MSGASGAPDGRTERTAPDGRAESASVGAPLAEARPGVAPERRPLVERLGIAAILAVLGLLFAFVAVASWVGGEVFLAAMGALGAGVTAWIALRALLRG